MEINLPNSAWIGNIDPFLKSFKTDKEDELIITSHDKWISVHPLVLAMIASIGLKVKSSGGKVEFKDFIASSRDYFIRMKLPELLNETVKPSKDFNEHEPAGRFIPLTIIKDSDQLTEFLQEMIPLLHLSPEQAEPIRYIVSELVRNVFEHSLSKEGAIICAQYYKKSNMIRIGVVDCGIGIKKSMSPTYAPKTHLESLKLALTPGITGTTRKIGGTERNAGAGLFFIKSIAKVNRDFFMIYSGNAMFKLLKPQGKNIKLYYDPSSDRHSEGEDYPYWDGNVVGIDISLNENPNFKSLLEMILKVYNTGKRAKQKQRYKQPRFI